MKSQPISMSQVPDLAMNWLQNNLPEYQHPKVVMSYKDYQWAFTISQRNNICAHLFYKGEKECEYIFDLNGNFKLKHTI